MQIWIWEFMKKPEEKKRLHRRGRGGAQSSRRSVSSFGKGLEEFAVFGLVPEGFELRPGDFGEGGSLFAGDFFHFTKAAGEFGAGIVQGDFGVDVEETGEIHGDEEDVAEFAFDAFGRFFFAEHFAEFGGFFAEFVEDAFDVVPVEADAGGFAGELEGLEKGGDGMGNPIEKRLGVGG